MTEKELEEGIARNNQKTMALYKEEWEEMKQRKKKRLEELIERTKGIKVDREKIKIGSFDAKEGQMKKRKPIEKLIIKTEKELDKQTGEQVGVIFGAAAIALWKEWGWRKERILRRFVEIENAWAECAANNNKSMLEMLEDETGIELTIPGATKSYHDLIFFGKGDIGEIKSPAMYLAMKRQQAKWLPACVMACMFLGLNRVDHFGPERLTRLMDQIEQIKNDRKNDPVRIVKECEELTGIDLNEVFAKEGKE